MKAIFCIIGVCATIITQAQRLVEQRYPATNQEVVLNLKFADKISVESWNQSEILIKASVSINNNQNNDKFVLERSEKDKYIEIRSKINDLDQIAEEKVVISQNKNNRRWNYVDWSDDDEHLMIYKGKQLSLTITYEIYLPQNQIAKIKTINGDITGSLPAKAFKAETISGAIDLKMEANQKRDLDIKTLDGDFYTDLTLNFPENSKEGLPKIKSGYGTKFQTKLNGGGEAIELKTINGNIYLRKK